MRNLCAISFLLIFFLNCSFAQEIEWQNTIGGSGQDELRTICRAIDGGFLLGGYSNSNISGDKSEICRGGDDYWVVKISSNGSIEWQRTIGGIYFDWLFSVSQTTDGGFILGGGSNSPVSNEKSDSCFGEMDYWVVKLDAVGNIQWQNVYGGALNEVLYTVIPTDDHGYILGGISNSNISGNKTDNVCGNSYDYWIVKLDSLGNLVWQTSIGGSGDDWLISILQTFDGGFICAGTSASFVSCDKTENNIGGDDYWVVKLDTLGNIQWQNTIGGSSADELVSILQSQDGGFVCGGYSGSNISGDKTDNVCNNSGDWWILKLDSIGSIIWQKTIGGNDMDYLSSISLGYGGEIYVGGKSVSDTSCYKTEICKGVDDYWIAKLDSVGNVLWQNTIGGSSFDRFYPLQATFDNGCIGGGWSNSNISGDKTEDCIGGWDFWVVKLTSNYNLISGKVFLDLNSNGIRDSVEVSIPGKKVMDQITGSFAFTNTNGKYFVVEMDSGSFAVVPQSIFWYSPIPGINNAHFNDFLQTDSLNDFAFQPQGTFEDVCITITPMGNFRSGFTAYYQINYGNYGTTTVAPTVYFYPDNNVTYQSVSVAPTQIFPDSMIWSLPTLTPFQTGSIIVVVNVNLGLPIGTLINSSAHIEPYLTDDNPSCNNSNWEVYTTGSFDPNDILVSEDTLTTTQLNNAPWLEYIIRFQNTGNDTAFTVKIINPIDTNKLNISSIEFVNASHPVNLNWINYQRNMEFKFENILLVDSLTNEPLSHGFVRYRIQPKTNLNAGDSITNFAAIYFDFNEPVITNTAKTIIVLPTGLAWGTPARGKLHVFPNPTENTLNISGIQLENGKAQLRITDVYGKLILEKTITTITTTLETNTLSSGIYLIQSGELRATFVKQ